MFRINIQLHLAELTVGQHMPYHLGPLAAIPLDHDIVYPASKGDTDVRTVLVGGDLVLQLSTDLGGRALLDLLHPGPHLLVQHPLDPIHHLLGPLRVVRESFEDLSLGFAKSSWSLSSFFLSLLA